MVDLRGGLIGCGYFARNHLHAWGAVRGARLAAVCDRRIERARAFAAEAMEAAVYADPREMLERERLDFVDIATTPETHRPLVELAAARKANVICQKPLAPSLEDAGAMVEACRKAGVAFMVHENFRFQAPMRRLKEISTGLGEIFFARISFRSGFDVYTPQPYLATDERFIIYDLGVHLLDLARFYVGEFERLHCETRRVNPRIRAEDCATILLRTPGGAACVVDCSFGTKPVDEIFPQTLIHLEGAAGTASLGPNYRIELSPSIAATGGKLIVDAPPRRWPWSVPPGDAIQDSVVATQQHWIDCLCDGKPPETSGEDNLKTLELTFGAYESAAKGCVFRPGLGAGCLS